MLAAALLHLLLIAASPSQAQQVGASLPPIDDRESIELPEDLDELRFYLITIDVGNDVWDNFGHTALRVVDGSSDTDLLFNWGLFDTSIGQLRFAGRFMRGIMEYRLGVYPTDLELERYRRQQRTVWQDRINLDNDQKRRLYQRLAWNLRDGNVVYDYAFFSDNCTTRVRDYLDEALQGALSEQSGPRVRRSFRDEVRAHYASRPGVAVGVDILLNSDVDRRMTEWEHMFLPLQLREELQGMQLAGTGAGEQPLLTDSRVLMEFSPPPSGPNAWLMLAGLWIPVLFLFSNMRRVPMMALSSRQGFTFRMPGLNYRLLGLLVTAIALCSGVFGALMLFAWTASSLENLHHNLNLLLFWPTDIFGVVYGLRMLARGRSCELGNSWHGVVSFYLLAHVLAAVVYLGAGLLGIAEQQVGWLMLTLVPILLATVVLVLGAGVHPRRDLHFI